MGFYIFNNSKYEYAKQNGEGKNENSYIYAMADEKFFMQMHNSARQHLGAKYAIGVFAQVINKGEFIEENGKISQIQVTEY